VHIPLQRAQFPWPFVGNPVPTSLSGDLYLRTTGAAAAHQICPGRHHVAWESLLRATIAAGGQCHTAAQSMHGVSLSSLRDGRTHSATTWSALCLQIIEPCEGWQGGVGLAIPTFSRNVEDAVPQCGAGAIHQLFLRCDWHVNRAVGPPLLKRTIPRLEYAPDRQVASRNPSEGNAGWVRRRETGFRTLRSGPEKQVHPR